MATPHEKALKAEGHKKWGKGQLTPNITTYLRKASRSLNTKEEKPSERSKKKGHEIF